MASGYIPDPIVENILTRLQAKPLLRLRCVSKHWYSLITDPHFLRSRSCRKIFLATNPYHVILDVDEAHEEFYPEYLRSDKYNTILGTLNGLVILLYPYIPKSPMIVFNPFTRACNKIPDSEYSSCDTRCGDAYGFGYGATTDDLKIIVLYNSYRTIACEVFYFKTSSWSTCTLQDTNIMKIDPEDRVGTFLNGYLYWILYGKNTLIALNLNDMVLSEIHLPFQRKYYRQQLGTVHGSLCLIIIEDYSFVLWVMNGQGVQNSWYSRKLCVSHDRLYMPICTLDKGEILAINDKKQPIIYDTSNDSYIVLDTTLRRDGENILRGIEYVESLFPPSGLCFA